MFRTVRKLKQLRFPSTDKWIREMCHIYTMEFYSSVRKNDRRFADKWMELEIIIPSEVTKNTNSPCSHS